MPKDFYDLLGVGLGATDEEIKQAYREKVKEYHPDRNDSIHAVTQFRTLKTARDTLLSGLQRERYDKLGHVRYVRSYGVNTEGFEFTGRNYRPAESSDSTNVADRIENIPFKPKIPALVTRGIVSILTVALFYMVTAISFVTAANGQLGGGLTPSGDLPITGHAVSVETFSSSPLLMLFPVMALALALTGGYIIKQLGGRKLQWLYVFGFANPILFMGIVTTMNAIIPDTVEWIRVTGHIVVAETFTFVPSVFMTFFLILVPAITTIVFVTDLSAYIIDKYAQFYIAHYRLKERFPLTFVLDTDDS